jgi:hypothetical protein
MSFKALLNTVLLAGTFLASPALAFSNFNYSGTDGVPGEEYYTLSNGRLKETAVRRNVSKRSIGCPINNPQASLRIGNQLRSTLLLQDINLIETIAHITHERTPERYTASNTIMLCMC